jgi:hypothetical protein
MGTADRASAFAATNQLNASVGKVTLVLGQATLVSSNGVTSSLQKGSSVKPGDRIETAGGGHVHIRFVDDALVSVRPSSRLIIEEYEYNPTKVLDSQVRFKLETGVARAISGAAAESAKERFRLNTPLVAIGVRGTDFVVNSQLDQTTAHVNQGAIVMAPLGAGCQASALGPCNTSAATLVSAQMGNVLAEYKDGLGQPELKPYFVRSTYFAAAPDPDVRSAKSPANPAKVDVAAKPDNSVIQVTSVVSGGIFTAAVEDLPHVPGPVEPPVLPPTPPAPPALVWGHWVKPTGSGDFSEPFRVAALGRDVTVGNSDYVLYRAPSDTGLTAIQPSLGTVGFQLQQAHALFRPWGGVNQEATAGTGTLSINFATRQFQTQLELNHAAAGAHTLTSQGAVLSDGMFGGATATQKVIGATTLDGKNAGYMFEKNVDSGVFNGITLWAR